VENVEDVSVVEIVGEGLARRRVEQEIRPERAQRGERAREQGRGCRVAGRQAVGQLFQRL